MPISALPLSYCTNVHPGQSLIEVEAGLDRFTVPVARGFGEPLAAGLWLAQPVVQELLAAPDTARQFADRLARRGLTCHTLNAFPYGNFHAQRVKEKVYVPDWSTEARLAYTVQCARVLAALLPQGVEGSISTLPLAFKGFDHPPGFVYAAMTRLIVAARELDRLCDETGKIIRLSIEPEPFCALETTAEAIDFFHRLWVEAERRGVTDIVRTHLGLCLDVCHQAVEFENVGNSVRELAAAGVRINKVHITCALQLENPSHNPDGCEALKRYAEPRYLHQTFARGPEGRLARAVDLTEQLVDNPPADFLEADAWRVHFHVPVDAERLGPLATTRPALREALGAVAALDYAPHLEVETYTWQVLPGDRPPDLVEGLTRELLATKQQLAEVG